MNLAVTQRKLLERIRHAYHAAPHLDSVSAFLEPLFPGDDETVASFNVRALRALQELLGLRARLVLASERAYPRCRTAQERVIRICLEEGGTRYVNPIRARSLGLYDQAAFDAAGSSCHISARTRTSATTRTAGHSCPI